MRGRILERESDVGTLTAAVRRAAGGAGAVALIYGEAGIGKSSLIETVRAQLPPNVRFLIGYCDDLATPRALGPFRDLIGSVGTNLSSALQDGRDRDRVLAALRTELDALHQPTLLVVEDVHWADEATLDVLRFLVRRISGLPAVLALTYRDDELTRDHPLHQLLGHVTAAQRVHRLALRRLSADAVRELGSGRVVDAERVYAVTDGNPFFVNEVLAAGDGSRVPPTIVDAVLARVRRLPPDVQDALEQLAVVPTSMERWLVDAVLPGRFTTLAAAEQRGLLTVSPARVAFRHELTRRAIADSIPTARLVELNRRVLASMIERSGVDLSRIVHHAAQAGDVDAIVEYGPAAARDAAAAGAHREAAAHYALVLEHASRFSTAERAELLEQHAVECYTIGAAAQAVASQLEAGRLRRMLGDRRALGANLRWLSRMHWWNGDRVSAEAAAREAIAVAEHAGDPRLLALTLSNQSQLDMLAGRDEDAINVGERAVALAREVDDAAILSHALANVGTAQWHQGNPSGHARLDEALQVALAVRDVEDACRAYANIIWNLLDSFRLAEAERYLADGMELAESAEFLGFLTYLQVARARLLLARGEWDDAVRTAALAEASQPPMRCPALTVIGRVRVRRGEPLAEEPLLAAWDLAVEIDELQRLAPVAAARAEAAWLRGNGYAIPAIVKPTYDLACRTGDAPARAELAYWLTKAGHPVGPIADDHPYALQATGRWKEAVAAWEAAGCAYERAAALAESPDAEDLLVALAILDELGAGPLARMVRARLRDRGLTRVPRGPTRPTKANPAGLTERQLEIVRLVAAGLTNAEIADRLVLSVRTVENHVAAALDKLGARTRQEATSRAAELGIVPDAVGAEGGDQW